MRLNTLLLLSFFTCSLSAQIRYLEPVFDQVSRTPNIIYGSNATVVAVSGTGQAISQPLILDFYEPTGDTLAVRPLVLVVSGGEFLPKNVNGTCEGGLRDSSVVEICQRLARMGYAAAAVDYRLGWNPATPQQTIRMMTYVQAMYRGMQDARTVIRFFKKTVAEDANPYRIDTTRIVLWGESNGGEIALGAAYANTPNDWIDPSLIISPPNVPAIIPAYLGNIWGTDYGVLDAAGAALFGLPIGDTLCQANWPGYSSDFQLCVSMAGKIPDLPWIDPGEVPAVLFHAPNDAWRICNTGTTILPPPLSSPILSMAGSCSLAAQLDLAGNNQVFFDANLDDCLSNQAYGFNGNLEGFFPFVGLPAQKGRPWQWTAPCVNNPTGPTDGAFARQYLDTVLAYFAPRACAALALCNIPPDPSGLCGTQAKGKIFLDGNQNDTLDLGEPLFPGIVVELQPGDYHAASGPTGKFSISAPPGDYNLDVPMPPKYYASSNTPLPLSIATGNDFIRDIGLHATVTANDLQVFVTPFSKARPGFQNQYALKWKNVGTTSLSGSVSFLVDPNYFIQGSNPPAIVSGDTATWHFFNLEPYHSGGAVLKVLLGSMVPLGTELVSTLRIDSVPGILDETPEDNIAISIDTVIGSFDPNDKKVAPSGDVTAAILEAHQGWLDYTVRFQNTGTAPAVNVHLVDTLSTLLNINSLEVIGSSHPMHWELRGQRTLTFYFDNIQLPDSLHNEAASHGFVRYRIQPNQPFEDLLNKTALNFADIYFDFNAPIRTNTTETRFTEESGIPVPEAAISLRVVPNPAGDFILIEQRQGTFEGEATLRILNAAGKQVYVSELSGSGPVEVPAVKNWPRGIYFVQIQSKNGVLAGRFVKG